MQDADRDHLIEAIDSQLAKLWDEYDVLDEVLDLPDMIKVERSIENLNKQRREILND